MENDKYSNFAELIYWSYSNLAMAHAGLERNHLKYNKYHYIIRAKLFKGLKEGTMNIRSIIDDEKIKLKTGQICNYCGSHEKLSIDHMIPRYHIKTDSAENLIYACQICNSSKGKKDLFEWMHSKNEFLPIFIIRRYIKLVYYHAEENNLLALSMQDLKKMTLPYKPEFIPISYPPPAILKLYAKNKNE